MKRIIFATIFSLIVSLNLFAATRLSSAKTIYGDDNRSSFPFPSSKTIEILGKSTAAMVPIKKVTINNSRLTFNNPRTLLSSWRVCEGVKFSKEITPAYCSGFLITEDILVTAGHCMKSQNECDKNLWIFDFTSNDAEINTEKSVYRCVKILDREFDTFGLHENDYAVIKLDRLTNRSVLPIRSTGEVPDNAKLVISGHPSGLPLKIAGGAGIRDNSDYHFFSANLDAFSGNSGSPVIDLNTGLIEGILVRGEIDYERDTERSCYVVKRVANNRGRGEDVTRITNIDLPAILDGTIGFEPTPQ